MATVGDGLTGAQAQPRRYGPWSLVLWRCGAFRPVHGFWVGGHPAGEAGGELGVAAPRLRPSATYPASTLPRRAANHRPTRSGAPLAACWHW